MKINLSMLCESAVKVEKLWGIEYWLLNNDKYCTKILEIFPGYQCSLHMHPVKDETFTVLGGRVQLEHGLFTNCMEEGDSQRIFPGTYHRFRTINGATILETSTEHRDEDVVRREESRRI